MFFYRSGFEWRSWKKSPLHRDVQQKYKLSKLRMLELAMKFDHGFSIKSCSVLVFGYFWVAMACWGFQGGYLRCSDEYR
jgi:hypothetical protein